MNFEALDIDLDIDVDEALDIDVDTASAEQLRAQLDAVERECEATLRRIKEKEQAERQAEYRTKPQLYIPAMGLLTQHQRDGIKTLVRGLAREPIGVRWCSQYQGAGVSYGPAAQDPERRERLWGAVQRAIAVLPKRATPKARMRVKGSTITWGEAEAIHTHNKD